MLCAARRPKRWAGLCKGASGIHFFDAGDNIVGNQNGFAVQFAAAYHAVADRADTGIEAVGFEFFHQGFNCTGVVGLGRQVNFVFFRR